MSTLRRRYAAFPLSGSPAFLLALRLQRDLLADAIGIFALCAGLGAGVIIQQHGGELTPLRGVTLGAVLAGHSGLFLYRARTGIEYAAWLMLTFLFVCSGLLLWGKQGLSLGLGCSFALHHGLCAWAFHLKYELLLYQQKADEAARQMDSAFARRIRKRNGSA